MHHAFIIPSPKPQTLKMSHMGGWLIMDDATLSCYSDPEPCVGSIYGSKHGALSCELHLAKQQQTGQAVQTGPTMTHSQ